MKTFIITYKTENGNILTSTVKCKSIKLTKRINDYFYHCKSEILSINEQL